MTKSNGRKLSFYLTTAFRFQKIRPVKNSIESVPYPNTLQEAKEFVKKYKKFAVGN